MMDLKMIGTRAAALALAVATVGCGSDTGGGREELGSVEQEIGVVSCATVAPDAVDNGDLNTLSPSSYNNCYKAYVVDLLDWDFESDNYMYVRWDGPRPTTKSTCEAAWMRAITYELVNDEWVQIGETVDDYGQWYSSGWCATPWATWTTYPLSESLFTPGGSYRFAATARSSYGSSYTRAMYFGVNDG
jgi:hypothetical protein